MPFAVYTGSTRRKKKSPVRGLQRLKPNITPATVTRKSQKEKPRKGIATTANKQTDNIMRSIGRKKKSPVRGLQLKADIVK